MSALSPQTKLLLASIAALSMTACGAYKIKYKNPTANPGATHSVKQNFFLWGHFGGEEVNFEQLCPGGVARVQSESSFVDGLLYGLTGGLYAPRSVEVQCNGGTAYNVTSDGKRVAVRKH
jgi:hypothetical protein